MKGAIRELDSTLGALFTLQKECSSKPAIKLDYMGNFSAVCLARGLTQSTVDMRL